MQNLTNGQKKKHSLFSLASGLGAHAESVRNFVSMG